MKRRSFLKKAVSATCFGSWRTNRPGSYCSTEIRMDNDHYLDVRPADFADRRRTIRHAPGRSHQRSNQDSSLYRR